MCTLQMCILLQKNRMFDTGFCYVSGVVIIVVKIEFKCVEFIPSLSTPGIQNGYQSDIIAFFFFFIFFDFCHMTSRLYAYIQILLSFWWICLEYLFWVQILLIFLKNNAFSCFAFGTLLVFYNYNNTFKFSNNTWFNTSKVLFIEF